MQLKNFLKIWSRSEKSNEAKKHGSFAIAHSHNTHDNLSLEGYVYAKNMLLQGQALGFTRAVGLHAWQAWALSPPLGAGYLL